jgi:predicted NBD/HSP70 family sugar kinase
MVAELFKDARAGDELAVKAIESAAEPLGRAIANLLNMLNPERVLLGGSLGEVLELARPEVEAAVVRYTFGEVNPADLLALPAFGTDSALLGAGEVAFTDLLADPH